MHDDTTKRYVWIPNDCLKQWLAKNTDTFITPAFLDEVNGRGYKEASKVVVWTHEVKEQQTWSLCEYFISL